MLLRVGFLLSLHFEITGVILSVFSILSLSLLSLSISRLSLSLFSLSLSLSLSLCLSLCLSLSLTHRAHATTPHIHYICLYIYIIFFIFYLQAKLAISNPINVRMKREDCWFAWNVFKSLIEWAWSYGICIRKLTNNMAMLFALCEVECEKCYCDKRWVWELLFQLVNCKNHFKTIVWLNEFQSLLSLSLSLSLSLALSTSLLYSLFSLLSLSLSRLLLSLTHTHTWYMYIYSLILYLPCCHYLNIIFIETLNADTMAHGKHGWTNEEGEANWSLHTMHDSE